MSMSYDNIAELISFENLTVHCKEPISEIIFDAKPVDIMLAEYKVNKLFTKTCCASLKSFFDFLDIEVPNDKREILKSYGWYSGCQGPYNYDEGPWITFSHVPTVGDDGSSYFEIQMTPMPCTLWMTCEDYICDADTIGKGRFK